MTTRNRGTNKPPAPARPTKETPRQRHDRMLLEINAFLAQIDDTLAECSAALAVLPPAP